MYTLYCEWLNNQNSQSSPTSAALPECSDSCETVTACSDHDLPVSRRAYREIFVRNFNYGFGTPRSDTCATCDSGDSEAHKQKAALAFAQQKVDREQATADENTIFITFNLQKTMPLPKLSTGISFYLRQLWLYNAGIHMVSAKGHRAFFYIWTEAEAKRGCEEIDSSLLAFIEETGLGRAGEPCRLITWCDSCAGQNKNFFILCLWQFLILTKKFSAIEQVSRIWTLISGLRQRLCTDRKTCPQGRKYLHTG